MAAKNTELLNVVLGNPAPLYTQDVEDVNVGQKFLDVFKSHGFFDIDTARGYFFGEQNFARLNPQKQGFRIDTKVLSFEPKLHQPEKVRESVSTSLSLLKVDKVHILYLHSPDRETPFEVTLKVINDIYNEGKFEKFGLSNYTAAEVQQIIDLCNKNNWVRPTVYQGNYSILVRKGEDELFPLLKKEKIAFYAWSPLAGGLLTGRFTTKEQLTSLTHFSNEKLAPIFNGLFAKDSIFTAVGELVDESKKFNLSITEVAVRWLAYHSQLSKSAGDAVILGGSKPEQFDNNIKDMKKGPLPQEVVDFIEKLWLQVKEESPAYHF